MDVSGFVPALSRRGFLGSLAAPAALSAASWSEFRGGDSGAASSAERLPLEWSDEKNLLWSVAPPGYGQSSPVVYGGRVFVTGVAGERKEELLLSAFDLRSGAGLWTHRGSPAQPMEVSDMVSKAAPSPAADADGVYAFFETGNVAALDRGGRLRWERRLTEEFGEFGGRHGIGSSLRLCRAGVMALVAHDGPSYLICLDRATGETVWKADRPPGVSWSTPALARVGGREAALVSGGERVDAYDAADGSLLWSLDGFKGAFVASPTPIDGGAIIGSSEKGRTAAIRFGAEAREAPRVVWRTAEAASYFSSPLAHRSRAYMVNKSGVAFCLRLDTGERLWLQRLRGGCWASSIACGDCVYFFGVDGAVEVYRAADKAEKIAENRLSEESRLYAAAVAPGRLLLRFGRRLACIAKG